MCLYDDIHHIIDSRMIAMVICIIQIKRMYLFEINFENVKY